MKHAQNGENMENEKDLLSKIKNIFDFKQMKKDKLLIFFLAGILLIIIAIPTGNSKKDSENKASDTDSESTQTADTYNYDEHLEEKLEKILSNIDGAGDVKVMITFKDSGENIVEKDSPSSTKNTTANSADNVSETTKETTVEETTVYVENDEGSSPYVSQKIQPCVEGILIISQGADNSVTVQNISDAVLALFDIEAHKIKVVKMSSVGGD